MISKISLRNCKPFRKRIFNTQYLPNFPSTFKVLLETSIRLEMITRFRNCRTIQFDFHFSFYSEYCHCIISIFHSSICMVLAIKRHNGNLMFFLPDLHHPISTLFQRKLRTFMWKIYVEDFSKKTLKIYVDV